MAFVKRNDQGAVVAVADGFGGAAPEGWEEVAADHADLLAFRYPDLAALREQVKARVDAAAEAVRLKYVTPGSAQAMVYREKAEEAARLQDDPAPDPADYPILAASVGIEASTLALVAQQVLAKKALWTLLAAAIEAVRLGAKRDIDAAATAPAIEAIAANLAWPV